MTTQWVCEHDSGDPNHLICESKDPRRHGWINAFIIGGVLWFVFLSGLVLWIILSRGEGGLATCPTWCAGLSEPLLRTRVSAGDAQYAECLRCAPARADNQVILDEDNTMSALREGSPQDSFNPRAPISERSGYDIGEGESLDYSGQIELYPNTNEFGVGAYLEAEAVYFSKEGEQVGRGPWPPRVGEETRLKVFLRIVARLQDRSDLATITGKLPPNVAWTGFAPMGVGLTYEPATRTVRFIPREGNTAVFEVAIIPIAEQLNEKQLIIIDNLKMILDDREILSPSILIQW